MRFLYLIFISFCFSQFLLAQNPYAIKISEQDNLPNQTVYDIIEDKDGIIWICTEKGLSKYNGISFKEYKVKNQNLLAGSIIKEDKYGRIWYENFDGYVFYVENNELKKISQNKPIGFVPFGITDEKLFVVQQKGIDVFDLKSLKLIKTISINIQVAEHATTFLNNYYLISDDTVFKINDQLNIETSEYFKNKKLHVKYIFPDDNGLYVLSKLNEEKTIYFFDKNLKLKHKGKLPQLNYIQGSSFLNNVIWIYTTKGTYKFNKVNNRLDENNFFEDLSISKIITNQHNNYWISTTNDGIRIVPNLKDKYFNISSKKLRSITQKNDSFLIGTQNGELIECSKNFSKVVSHCTISENLPTYYLYCDELTNSVFFSNKGFNIVNNGNFHNLKNYDIALKEIVRIDDKYYAFASSNFCALFKDPVTNNNSTSIWDSVYTTNKYSKYPEIATIIKNIRAKSVAYNKKTHTIIFATNIGTFSYTSKGKKEILQGKNAFYTSKVFNIKNKIFAISVDGNLYEISNDLQLKKIPHNFSFLHNGILNAKNINETLYLTSTDGIYTFNGDVIEKINAPIKTQKINDFQIDNNTLYALTDEGVITINLENQYKKYIPKFTIDKLTANENEKPWNQNSSLNYHLNNINISFSLIEYINKNVKLYYRINNSNWISIETNVRNIELPSLAAGKYTVEFKIENEIHPEKVTFEITLPFWKKWWFYLLITVLVVTIAYLYFTWQFKLFKNRIQLINEKISLENDLSKSTLKAIKSQMNPHFFYNALNTIQAYIFTNEKTKANTYLAKFSKLTRFVLEMSEKETISLSEEIDSLKLYLELEQMRFNNDLEYVISYDEDLLYESIEFPPMLIQPYVENAVKHGLLHSKNEKVLHIDFKRENTDLIVIIDDNGVGRKKANEINNFRQKNHESFSTKANEQRLDILNKGRFEKIAVHYIDKHENEIANGTTVILTIPLNE